MNTNKEHKIQSQNKKQVDSTTPKNKELQKLVQNNKHFEFLPSGKIKCILTNHEILPTLQEFQSYLNGKSYKNAQEEEFDFSQFEPYIVAHKTDQNKMFCNLTRQNISKKKSVVLKHVNGKRYKHYLSKHLEEQAKLEQEQNDKNENEEKELLNELEELQNLANDEEMEEEDSEPKVKQQGILKNGKKIQKKQQQQKQKNNIENVEEKEDNTQKVKQPKQKILKNKNNKKPIKTTN